MPRATIKSFGAGRWTDENASKIPLGAARDSLNVLHGKRTEAKRRNHVKRVYHTRPANAVMLGAFEHNDSSLGNTYLYKQGTALYAAADLAAGTSPSSILTGMASGFLPQFANANGVAFIADSAANYVSKGASATTHELQRAAGASGAISGTSSGSASGNAAGTVYYSYTYVDSVTGAESPPSTAISVSRSADAGVSLTNVSLSFSAPWTTANFYRTKAGESQMYRVITGITAANFAANLSPDLSLDTSLTTVSTVHDEDSTAASIEKPEAAEHVVFHRGRLFLGNLTSLGSRLRWSRLLEPTQFENYTTARMDVGKFDGGEITGLVSFRGRLVIFKSHSIWVMSGDVDEDGFVFSEVVVGTGCIAPRSIAVDADRGIYFLSESGVCAFDLADVHKVAEPILSDFDALEYADRSEQFCAGIEPNTHRYLLSVTPDGGSANTTTHALNIDTGAWGRDQYSMGTIKPSCYAVIRNADNRYKLFLGDTNGYLYETDTSADGDGVISGDVTGTVTGYNANVTTCSAASFYATGDDLKGIAMTLRRAADDSYESVEITSNTGTAITHAAFSGTNPVAGDTIYIGAFQSTLHLNRIDAGTGRKKRFQRVEIEFEKQSHTMPLRVGYALDADAAPTATTEYEMDNGFVARCPIHRRGYGLSLYFDLIGSDAAFDLIGVHLDWHEIGAARPTS